MKKHDDFLVEIHTEELPPKSLLKLAEAFCKEIKTRLQKANLDFNHADYYATPRRLSVVVKGLIAEQPEQKLERKGPALEAAFDKEDNPTPACLGFARSCGVGVSDLFTIKTEQGSWVGFRQSVKGQSVQTLLPEIIQQAANALPIAKRMRWGAGEAEFVRPVHSVILLYGTDVIDAEILGCKTGRVTRGHRFLSPGPIIIPHPSEYESLLETQGKVIANFEKRKQKICDETRSAVKAIPFDKDLQALIDDSPLLEEITSLVEWPTAIIGKFDREFLKLPQEVLISAMKDHQRYFAISDFDYKLVPYFAAISNIKSSNMARITHGNERVLRARLSDAAFFYETDKKQALFSRLDRLKHIVFQAKLGSLFDKAERLRLITVHLASLTGANKKDAERAGLLAKVDLTTEMVGEFPELQGIMGGYYAIHDGESSDVANALREHYSPRFSGGFLPQTKLGCLLAIADRLDNLVGAFGTHQIPTGDKDPFALRRAAIGLLRLLIEKQLDLDLNALISYTVSLYGDRLENKETLALLFNFMQDRLKSWYQEQGFSTDIFASVAALDITNPLDMDKRLKAVKRFKEDNSAESLSVANKRVSNILAKYSEPISIKTIDRAHFENDVEADLVEELARKSEIIAPLYQSRDYDAVLAELAKLRQPIDDFFDKVMVMTEDKSKRENRLLMLAQVRALFLQVADIALLQ